MASDRQTGKGWPPSLREARGHAILCASILWIVAGWLVSNPGPRDRLGELKGRDFAFFYTLGHLVLSGQASRMYDMDAEHEVRSVLIPASAPDGFASAYPPQTAVLFAPYALLPYRLAWTAWMATTALVYFWGLALAVKRSGVLRLDRTMVFAAAAAFPPFWNLMLGGQSTTWPLLGLTLGWLALERRWPFTAGLALGLLAIKPQLGLAFALVTLWHREWRIIAGAAVSIAVQIALAWLTLGGAVVTRYFSLWRQATAIRRLLQPHVYQVQSLQVLTDLLPAPLQWPAWIAAIAVVVTMAGRVWSQPLALEIRLGAVVMASVLASPHLLTYDLTLLALPVVWWGAFVARARPDQLGRFAAFCYALFVTLLVPTRLVMYLQLSVITLFALFASAVRWGSRRDAPG